MLDHLVSYPVTSIYDSMKFVVPSICLSFDKLDGQNLPVLHGVVCGCWFVVGGGVVVRRWSDVEFTS